MGDSANVSAAASAAPAASATATPIPQDPGSNWLALSSTALGGARTAYSQFGAGRTNERISNDNARIAAVQADEAQNAGEFAANQAATKARVLEGQQRAGQAGQGVVAGVGSAGIVTAQTDQASAMDELMIKRDAARRALGYQIQEGGDRIQGEMARQKGDEDAMATLLNTGAKEWLMSDPSHRRISFQ